MAATPVALAARHLPGRPHHVAALDHGHRHETHLLALADRRYVRQFVADHADRPDDPALGLACYRRLADTPVPVPRVLTDGVATGAGRRYTLVTACPGADAETDVTPARARAAGRVLAAIHGAHTFERAGHLRVPAGPTGALVVEPVPGGEAAWLADRVERALPSLRAAGLETAAAAVADLLARTDLSAVAGPPAVLRHGDCSPDTLLFEGDRLTGVVDLDRAGAGHPGWDLAAAATTTWMHDPTADWHPRGRVHEGYRAVRPLPPGYEAVADALGRLPLAVTVGGMASLGTLAAEAAAFHDPYLRGDEAMA